MYETSNVVAVALCLTYIIAQIFSVDDFLREEVEMGVLVIFIQREHFIPILTEIADELAVGIFECLRVLDTLDGIHGMILAYRVNV